MEHSSDGTASENDFFRFVFLQAVLNGHFARFIRIADHDCRSGEMRYPAVVGLSGTSYDLKSRIFSEDYAGNRYSNILRGRFRCRTVFVIFHFCIFGQPINYHDNADPCESEQQPPGTSVRIMQPSHTGRHDRHQEQD